MKRDCDGTGVREQGEYVLLPEGEYDVVIEEVRDTDKDGNAQETKNGDPMITIKLVPSSGVYQDEAWVWDNITISDNPNSPGFKILGRSKHFLHCIGEPYEDKFSWDSANWLYKKCRIKVEHEPPNQYHKKPKAIVSGYILTDDLQEPAEDSPL
ncbi:MAG: hypothetical protein WC332_01565 [Clostridia bacterium]|jgi:hypothetical protein